jgi:hypothetical protein
MGIARMIGLATITNHPNQRLARHNGILDQGRASFVVPQMGSFDILSVIGF